MPFLTPPKQQNFLRDQRGTYLIVSTIVLSVLFGFAALGIEIGRWYAIQNEISKAVDGAAFAGAKNVSNLKFSDANGDPDEALLAAFVEEVAAANFPSYLLGTDTPVFNVTQDGNGRVQVTGNVHSINSMTTVFETGTPLTDLGKTGAAQLRQAEIALVLDVSGSMNAEDAISNLRDGATTFVNSFQSFQKDHKFALITFATGVQTPVPLAQDFVFDMTNEIDDLIAAGGTNTEDALGQTVNLLWEPDQLAVPVNLRTQQVVVLFSDGNPTGFRAQFKYNGTDLDAVALLHNGDPPTNVWGQLGKHDEQVNYFTDDADNLGDGEPTSYSLCGSERRTTKWYIFDDPTYGISNYGQSPMTSYSSPYCVGEEPSGLLDYSKWLVRQMAIDHAAELKAQGIIVYTIGLGSVDQNFLETLATDADHGFFTNDPAKLKGIFQTIANKLKLILVS